MRTPSRETAIDAVPSGMTVTARSCASKCFRFGLPVFVQLLGQPVERALRWLHGADPAEQLLREPRRHLRNHPHSLLRRFRGPEPTDDAESSLHRRHGLRPRVRPVFEERALDGHRAHRRHVRFGRAQHAPVLGAINENRRRVDVCLPELLGNRLSPCLAKPLGELALEGTEVSGSSERLLLPLLHQAHEFIQRRDLLSRHRQLPHAHRLLRRTCHAPGNVEGYRPIPAPTCLSKKPLAPASGQDLGRDVRAWL